MFSFAQEFSQRKFFVCNPSSESKYCKVTSLPGSLAASAKLHRSDCEYVIALLSYKLLVWLRK